ncbi:hypothetical protein M0R04_02765 [Candidatus Dojkabacteria bacterium]|jgi:hypothetical protein|nr:hypothetical protein [Candidatus Dojkabacteria bacterium]
MDNKDYTKIKLRDFRKNLTQLKDGLAFGVKYEVLERGKSIGYFIPSQYEITLKKKVISQEDFNKILNEVAGKFEFKKPKKKVKSYKDEYLNLLLKKYNPKN